MCRIFCRVERVVDEGGSGDDGLGDDYGDSENNGNQGTDGDCGDVRFRMKVMYFC